MGGDLWKGIRVKIKYAMFNIPYSMFNIFKPIFYIFRLKWHISNAIIDVSNDNCHIGNATFQTLSPTYLIINLHCQKIRATVSVFTHAT